jgi:hypothetical protein
MPSTPSIPNVPTPEDKYAVSAWGQAIGFDHTVPSGQTCRLRKPGIQGLIDLGLMEDMDFFKSIIGAQLIPQAGSEQRITPEEATQALLDNPERLTKFFDVLDRIVVYTVIQPQVLPKPPEGVEREDGVIYVDSLDPDDKLDIMQFAMGGQRAMATFRSEPAEGVGDVPDGEGVQLSTQ